MWLSMLRPPVETTMAIQAVSNVVAAEVVATATVEAEEADSITDPVEVVDTQDAVVEANVICPTSSVIFCGKTGHVKVNCFEWKKKQGQAVQATASTATAEKTYSVSLMATAVAGCRREEYSYVPADQEFGEPTHWSFDAYERNVEDDDIPEPENQEVIAFEDPYGMPSNLVLRDQMLPHPSMEGNS